MLFRSDEALSNIESENSSFERKRNKMRGELSVLLSELEELKTKESIRYEIAVSNPSGVNRGVVSLELDGEAYPAGDGIPLADDGGTHRVRVVLGDVAVSRPERAPTTTRT